MGLFKLIEQGKYQEFCCLYEEKAGIRNSHPELADLIPGNYLLALLGLKDYNKIVEVCEKHVLENVNRKGSLNRSTSDFYIACSIAKMELGNANEAYKILYDGIRQRQRSIQDTIRRKKFKVSGHFQNTGSMCFVLRSCYAPG